MLPPLPGAGGRWTLVVGQDVAHPSTARITTLSAMLGTGVQVFARAGDASRHCLLVERGAVQREVDVTEADLPRVAAEWSVDPTTLSGPAPGSALLVGALRADPIPGWCSSRLAEGSGGGSSVADTSPAGTRDLRAAGGLVDSSNCAISRSVGASVHPSAAPPGTSPPSRSTTTPRIELLRVRPR